MVACPRSPREGPARGATRPLCADVEFGGRLTALLDDIEQELPIGYVLDYATYQPELIVAAVESAVSNVYQTLAIVLAVITLFLGLRTGLIVGSFADDSDPPLSCRLLRFDA